MRRVLETAGFDVVGTVVEHPDSGECKLDLTSADDCKAVVDAVAPDHVIHLAAISFVQHADPAAFYAVNVVGTTHLLDALAGAEKRPRQVLLASSANVYGNVGGAALTGRSADGARQSLRGEQDGHGENGGDLL